MIKRLINIFIFILLISSAEAQVEYVPVQHPVYSFLELALTDGLLENFSLSCLPLQRNEICDALLQIRTKSSELTPNTLASLEIFEKEFDIRAQNNAVLFYSETDTIQVLTNLLSEKEKYFYRYADTNHSVYVQPLGSFDFRMKSSEEVNENVSLGTLGLRLRGTLGKHLGYYLQATNGVVLSGNRELAMEDRNLRQNVKFHDLNSDFDFAESHVIFSQDWLYIGIGRQTRLWGAGLMERALISASSPPIDAVEAGVKFKTFEYKFLHGRLLAQSTNGIQTGSAAERPQKYLVFHRFSVKPSWGEFSFWESVVYSGRSVDIAYLNPIIFLKSEEHALHDPDNSMMGIDFTIRPFKGLQLTGTYVLDDIIFSEIGKNFWCNKAALNTAIAVSLGYGVMAGFEYSRIEPYTYSHFKLQNSYTNDNCLIGSELQPNSDEFAFKAVWHFGWRYPVEFKFGVQRHGANITDSTGVVIFNAGADPLLVRRDADSERIYFLGGKREDCAFGEVKAGMEIVKGFNLNASVACKYFDSKLYNYLRIKLAFEDF
jgi:hypothetical protein